MTRRNTHRIDLPVDAYLRDERNAWFDVQKEKSARSMTGPHATKSMILDDDVSPSSDLQILQMGLTRQEVYK